MNKLYSTFFILLSILLFSCSEKAKEDINESSKEISSADKPNFVVIFCDDLGYGDIGPFGNEVIRTPHLDQMAADGMKLSSFYSASPICSPSRAGLMTGRYPYRFGIHGVFFPESWTGLDTNEVTIANALKSGGYATGIVGKWHLGHHRQYLPLQRGFDEYFGIPYSNDMEAVVYLDGNDMVDHDVDQSQTTKTYTNKAVDFIDRHKEEPFFLYLAHSMPHVPLYASEEFAGKSERGLYGDVIEEIDWSVGQVLEKLEKEGLSENTLVLFTSDNGPWLIFGPEGGSAGPLREGKQFTFEGGMRVPTLAMWKGKIKGGTEYAEMANMMDLFPTFTSLAGIDVETNGPLDGVDISNVLLEGEKRSEEELAYFAGGKIRAYRLGDWKIKLPFAGTKGKWWKTDVPAHDTLLFNLKEDIGEKNDLSKSNPEQLAKLVESLEAFRTKFGEMPEGLKMREPADNSHKIKQKEWLKSIGKAQ